MNQRDATTEDDPRAGARPMGVRSVEVAARVLAALAELPAAATLTRLAAAAGMPPGKAHRYLVSLVRAGLVEQDTETGRYGIGPLAIGLGLAGLRQLDPVRAAAEALAALRDEVDETAVLAIWGNRGPVVVRILESAKPVSMNMRPGFVLPVLTSAIGLMFAAHLPASAVTAALARDGDAAQPALGDVQERLAAIRAQGLIAAPGILVPGISVLAAPYFNHEGAVAGVLALLGQREAFDIGLDGPAAGALKRAAGRVSARLGRPAAGP